MEAKFPIFDFVKQSFVQTFAYGKGLLITLGAIIALTAAIFAVFMLLGFLTSASGGSTGAMIAGGIITIVLSLYAMGWIFNYWVRYGAEGRNNLLPNGFAASLTPALATGLKLLFIGILLAIVAAVIIMITGILGLGVKFNEIATLAQMDTLQAVKALGIVYLIIFGVTCSVYSIFSSNLTKTALGREDEEIGEPHVLEFALVLFLIYAAVYIPTTLMQSVMPEIAGLLVEAFAGLLLAALIPVAHGLRYDWQRQVYASRAAGGDTSAE
jgi:hypothetical protein